MSNHQKANPMPCTEAPTLIWDEQGLPHSTQYDDVYYSTTDALAETEFVFLDKNQLASRWSQLNENQTFTVCETGFGAGLNFLCTWDKWQKQNPLGNLHFISIEKYPLNVGQLHRAHRAWPHLTALSDELLEHYPPACTPGFHHIQLAGGRIKLTLIFDEVKNGLGQLVLAHGETNAVPNSLASLGAKQQLIDAWFFDGFTPAKNPEMWKPELFTLAAKLSKKGTSFATFTSARSVRDGIENAGFQWNKVPGFGLKREMLYGEFNPTTAVHPNHTSVPITQPKSYRKRNGVHHSWHLQAATQSPPSSALVIGAGLAGCHIANALARRGVNVTLVEQAGHAASGASGNLQGLTYTRLSLSGNPLAKFNMAAQLFADRYYHTNGVYKQCGEANGVFHLATNPTIEEQFKDLAKQHANDRTQPKFSWVEQHDTKQVCGVEARAGGLLVRQSGWINPVALCQKLLDHPLITPVYHTQVVGLSRDDSASGRWTAECKDTQHSSDTDNHAPILLHGEIAIICTARDAKALSQTEHLPIKNIRGQVSHLNRTPTSSELKVSMCGEGYIAPAQHGIHCTGATFNLHENTLALRDEDHGKNLENLAKMSPELGRDFINPQATNPLQPRQGRVGFRATIPDYFPIVGPVPEKEAFCEVFAGYRKRAATPIPTLGPYYQGLFVSVGFGSRGLAYTPIATELLCHSIFGEMLPVAIETALHLHPSRFLFRDLTRNRI